MVKNTSFRHFYRWIPWFPDVSSEFPLNHPRVISGEVLPAGCWGERRHREVGWGRKIWILTKKKEDFTIFHQETFGFLVPIPGFSVTSRPLLEPINPNSGLVSPCRSSPQSNPCSSNSKSQHSYCLDPYNVARSVYFPEVFLWDNFIYAMVDDRHSDLNPHCSWRSPPSL